MNTLIENLNSDKSFKVKIARAWAKGLFVSCITNKDQDTIRLLWTAPQIRSIILFYVARSILKCDSVTLRILLSSDLVATTLVEKIEAKRFLWSYKELISLEKHTDHYRLINPVVLSNSIIMRSFVASEDCSVLFNRIVRLMERSSDYSRMFAALLEYPGAREKITESHLDSIAHHSINGYLSLRVIMQADPLLVIKIYREEVLTRCVSSLNPSQRFYDLICCFLSSPTIVTQDWESKVENQALLESLLLSIPSAQTWHIFGCQYVKNRLKDGELLEKFVKDKVLKHPLLLEWRLRLTVVFSAGNRKGCIAALLPTDLWYEIATIGVSCEKVKPPVVAVVNTFTFRKEIQVQNTARALRAKYFS